MEGMRIRATVALVMLLAACGDAEPDQAPMSSSGDPADAVYASSLDVSLERLEQQPSGLYLEDLEVGSGAEARAGQSVVVHYTGWLPNGEEFDSSHSRNEPFTFDLGAAQVIRGWDEGVQGMREGGRRRLVIPGDMAYGSGGVPGVIPENAVLVFEVELLEVQ